MAASLGKRCSHIPRKEPMKVSGGLLAVRCQRMPAFVKASVRLVSVYGEVL